MSAKILKLIVHADDLGLSNNVNQGILEAHLRGIVTSASIMAGGVAFEHAADICRLMPTLDTGIHLTLVGERPVLDSATVPSLVGPDGKFHRNFTAFAWKYLTRGISLVEVRCELEAQIQKVMSRGLEVSHLDSHQHLHMLPQIFRVAVALAKKYRIPAIRIPRENLRAYMLGGKAWMLRVPQLLVLNMFCRGAASTFPLGTDYFAGFLFTGRLHKHNLRKVLEHLPTRGTCELMCHPGLRDPNIRCGQWGSHWADELKALTDPEISELLAKRGVQLISYRELGGYNSANLESRVWSTS